MTLMARELREIPDLVRIQTGPRAHEYRRAGSALRTFGPRFVVTCARGSSDNAATYLNYLCGLCMSLPVASVGPSISSVYGRNLELSGSVFVSISQSGRSPDLVAFQNMANNTGALTVALVNTAGSPLAGGAAHAVDIGSGNESAVAATKSFVCSLTAIAAIVADWSSDRELKQAVAALPSCLDAALAIDWHQRAPGAAGWASVYTVGRGPALCAAQEAALKFKETCQIHAESYSSAEVMHGPIQLAASGLSSIVFLSRDEARPGMLDAITRMAEAGVDVFVVDPENDERVGGGRVTLLPCVAAPHPLLDPVSQIVSFYNFVERLAGRMGFNPDSPHLLRKVTETV